MDATSDSTIEKQLNRYKSLRWMADIIRAFVVLRVLYLIVMIGVAFFVAESSAFRVGVMAQLMEITKMFGIYILAAVLDLLVDMAINFHKASNSLEQLANRANRR